MQNYIENQDPNSNSYEDNNQNIGIENVNNDNDEYEQNAEGIQPIPEEKNIKPLLGVIVALIIILLAYFFFWRSIAAKTKNIVADALSTFEYESIGVSGFPLSKNIKIKNIIFGNDTPFASKNKMEIGEISISSFIFGKTFNIKLKDISVVTADGTKYDLMYNGVPNIKLAFYPDRKIQKLEYKDNGYRVISAETNETLYTAGESIFSLESVENGNTADYSIIASFKDMQNIQLFNINEQTNTDNNIPEVFNMNIDISSSITQNNNGNISNYIIKIIMFDLLGNSNNGFQITGEIIKDADDIYSYGNIDFTLLNYKNILNLYKENLIQLDNTDELSISLGLKNKEEFIKIVNHIFNKVNDIILRNGSTTDNKGVISIVKQKNAPDYFINGQSLYGVIQDILLTE